ncbi:uncharacterized protein A1O9_00846 [Exophiala aquamarina CBS 119918]|uniref:F-box domain-containing protein n=1 Tax=Exophiala aquamarina CBS 119918 TaxID=1182545 RepID=A0A072PU60_9EURO|nr:uncharacterized protein A1O9_00846 [Exophiala aquamarina CBS 119918]KEF62873.1 hypothetical protein A1O9_00846 [Exophiala aquamarina CBS 119918]
MPKAKTARSKRARPTPYSKPLATASSSILKVSPNGQKPFPFLDLPLELRLSIYAYFLHMTTFYLPCLRLPLTSVPHCPTRSQAEVDAIQDSARDDESISKTRKSLNLVCLQITAEWSPLFYETTNSIVHASKRKLGFRPKHMVFDPYCNPWNFANDFLRVLHPSKLVMIKRIAYDIRPGNLDSFEDFPKLLTKHIDRISALEQITLHSYTYGLVDHGFLRFGYFPMDVWRTSPWRHRWEHIEQRFLGIGRKNHTVHAKKNGAGVLQGWNATRKLTVHLASPRDRYLTVRGVDVVFKKAGAATTETELPTIMLLWKGLAWE